MNEVNKTLFIPLYGKAQVSQKGLILRDQKAEEIWGKEAFAIAGKAKSRWLAYFMAMRARIFDDWANRMLALHPDALVLHIGCGLDSCACGSRSRTANGSMRTSRRSSGSGAATLRQLNAIE